MALTPGTRLGPYQVTTQIGAGGMGEVYRATDTNLKRAVAIKVVPASVAGDTERLARFQREAEVLAALNHPNIAQIYGLEKSGGITALVMELVEGPTLADRIADGGIPLDEALPIAKQIAEALEAAHEQGIIHRDLKPTNIKVRPDGVVKVLDFGLAKALEPMAALVDATLSPTITSPAMMTGIGVLLGTAAYMSPEQAKGSPADHRSDIYSFGSVLYEMLTGRLAFGGESAPEILASVLAREPDFNALPPNLSPRLMELLRRCLDKNPKRRWQAVGDLRADLEAVAAAPRAIPIATTAWVPESAWRRLAFIAVPALVLGAAVAGGTVWFATRPPVPRVTRLTLTVPAAAAPSFNGVDRDLAITPDGSRVVYVGARGTQLFVRSLDTLEPIALFTGEPRAPFVSPDGQWIGFVDATFILKRVAITGGPAVPIAQVDGGSRGATWLPDNTIVFAEGGPTGLQRVSAAGGTPVVLTRPDRDQAQTDHLWPEALPGGRGVLFTIIVTGGPDTAQVAVLDLQTGAPKVLVRGGSHAHYVSSGHLMYAAAGTLRAVAFDLDRLETSGTPVPVIPEVATTPFEGVEAVVAAGGTLAYMTGGAEAAGAARSLVWVDRQGQEIPIDAPPRAYVYPRLSPDGTRVAVQVADRQQDIWLWDLKRRTITPLTFDPAFDGNPVWSTDGRLFFGSERHGARNLYWLATDGTGAVERLTESPNLQMTTDVSRDGKLLIFWESFPKTSRDIMQLLLDGPRVSAGPGRGELVESHPVTSLVRTPSFEMNGTISPDGRWLAYEANYAGPNEVYVRSFPDESSERRQISIGGGSRPLWARDGQELFYLSPIGALMRVGVEKGGLSWGETTPSMLLKESDAYVRVPIGNLGRTYDISLDGQRFLMIKAGSADAGAVPPSIIVVQNWQEELKRLVPTK